MLDSYSTLKKHRAYNYLLINFMVTVLVLLLLITLIIVDLTHPSTSYTRVINPQSKTYIEKEFYQARWYSLVDTIDTEGNLITLNTYIFPDQEGRQLATEIVKDLREKGIRGEITIYGKNMSSRLLVVSKE